VLRPTSRPRHSTNRVSGKPGAVHPLGLGGGLNAYGFASGDPINFSDPFGLLVEFRGPGAARGRQAFNAAIRQLQWEVDNGYGDSYSAVALAGLKDIRDNPDFTYTVTIEGSGAAQHEGNGQITIPNTYTYLQLIWTIPHELGHAYSSRIANPLFQGNSYRTANVFGNRVRRALAQPGQKVCQYEERYADREPLSAPGLTAPCGMNTWLWVRP
jgi:hypothetical protein